ncbi:MAG: type II toxin-antitoxin system VapC family toxin [Trueperaceae bacterium]|nr:type II toxin-antitoxin system VapC family toxin [Trueperaceae bacterium]
MGGGPDGVRLLLDTHVLVWSATDPERLSKTATTTLLDPVNRLFVSSATSWEIATKQRIGKLPQGGELLESFELVLADLRASLISIGHEHAVLAGSMPGTHRDPFDRMLAAQAQVEDLHLITRDPAFSDLGVRVIW